MGKRYEFDPPKFYYAFGPFEPALKLRPGDMVATTTADAGSFDVDGKPLPPSKRYRVEGLEFHESNPLVGPFYVEGAEIGDTLVVRLEKILLNRDFAWSSQSPGFGALSLEDGEAGPMGLGRPLPRKRFDWKLDLERNVGVLKLSGSKLKRAEIPLHPFLGCIGTSPRFGEIVSSMTPGEHGGNMDCIETKQGTTVYLPVFARGAYLFLGDIHAAQGDGEICGVALEATAEVTFRVDLIKGKAIRWPRLEDRTHIMVAASARPLIDAFRIAHTELVRWLSSDYEFDQWEAFQLVSQAGRARVGNVVDPKYTVVAKFPKEYLP
ncbi:MAG: acetamidase/formamidase family protein [bacterium]